MTLRKFIDYRKKCPICDSDLSLVFHSGRRQIVRYEENRVTFITNLYNKNNRLEYKVGYSFDLDSNGWCAELYDKENIRYNKIPCKLRFQIKELDKNLGDHKFFMSCDECIDYTRISNGFTLKFSKSYTDPITVDYEYFNLIVKNNGLVKSHILRNFYNENVSFLNLENYSDDGENIDKATLNFDTLKLPLIPFVSKEDTLNRISKLIIFS